jgi:hypothetical protein
VKDFIELNGASGRAYRFRLWRPGAGHLPMAGNNAVGQGPPDGFSVLAAMAVDDLSRVQSPPAAADRAGRVHVFTRLNIARVVRQAEADDIAAFYGLGRAPASREQGG